MNRTFDLSNLECAIPFLCGCAIISDIKVETLASTLSSIETGAKS